MERKMFYLTKELCEELEKAFGHGKVSSNIERILRNYLANPANEEKIRLAELNKELRRFNADFKKELELVAGEGHE